MFRVMAPLFHVNNLLKTGFKMISKEIVTFNKNLDKKFIATTFLLIIIL